MFPRSYFQAHVPVPGFHDGGVRSFWRGVPENVWVGVGVEKPVCAFLLQDYRVWLRPFADLR